MKGREHVPVGGVDPNRSTISLNHRSGCAPLCTQSEDGIDGEGRAVMILESKTTILGVGVLGSRCSNSTTPEKVPHRSLGRLEVNVVLCGAIVWRKLEQRFWLKLDGLS